MDPLLPALVAVLAATAADRSPMRIGQWAVPGEWGQAVVPLVLVYSASFALAATGGSLVAPHLTPEARALLLAAALLYAGAAAFVPMRDPSPQVVAGPVRGAAALFVQSLGDRSQFLVFALAADGPVLAAVGGTLGAMVVGTTAATLGTEGWRRLPLRIWRFATGSGFLAVGLVVGLRALRLV